MSSPDKRGLRSADGNGGLPMDARRFYDPYVRQLLKGLHIEELNFDGVIPELDVDELRKIYLHKTGISTTIEVSSAQSRTFNGQLHPEVEGYRWQRGIAIEVHGVIPPLVGKNQVFIFTPEREATQDGIVYRDGNVEPSDILDVVRGYVAERQSTMQKIPADHR